MSNKNVWSIQGGSLSDKSARKEYNLTQEEIVDAIKEDKIAYTINSMHGNQYFKLLRSDVEKFVTNKYGADYITETKLRFELASVNKEINSLKRKFRSLEKRKKELTEQLSKPSQMD